VCTDIDVCSVFEELEFSSELVRFNHAKTNFRIVGRELKTIAKEKN
jgi:hypothetical protein